MHKRRKVEVEKKAFNQEWTDFHSFYEQNIVIIKSGNVTHHYDITRQTTDYLVSKHAHFQTEGRENKVNKIFKCLFRIHVKLKHPTRNSN